ncbi:hypothetical protein DICPUDRAFT_150532 [Dictyostelium purpureum]|uniref:SAP domain-containing protein n=1 Tax=Dictyostelium purpureum TaxID=5786 RepID=F0ZGK1_DICPU|nr:uncharacterized protein DICPUDRAFT_150532 [Dictyostelium purpureum]EGC36900.1 hypothetical protein DICPUDRAFT_150532 [Dictyostelium purpureum]|eukprot:XP_003286543.1 hypothetical protein DICPUDRAFT_150532 [Dictyostelium purpureum]
MDLSKLTVADLRKKLAKKGISYMGLKREELIESLQKETKEINEENNKENQPKKKNKNEDNSPIYNKEMGIDEKKFWLVFRNIVIKKTIFSFLRSTRFKYEELYLASYMIHHKLFRILEEKVLNGDYVVFNSSIILDQIYCIKDKIQNQNFFSIFYHKYKRYFIYESLNKKICEYIQNIPQILELVKNDPEVIKTVLDQTQLKLAKYSTRTRYETGINEIHYNKDNDLKKLDQFTKLNLNIVSKIGKCGCIETIRYILNKFYPSEENQLMSGDLVVHLLKKIAYIGSLPIFKMILNEFPHVFTTFSKTKKTENKMTNAMLVQVLRTAIYGNFFELSDFLIENTSVDPTPIQLGTSADNRITSIIYVAHYLNGKIDLFQTESLLKSGYKSLVPPKNRASLKQIREKEINRIKGRNYGRY